MSNDMNEIKKVKKVILFYNPSSGSGMFKNNLDNIIGRYQEAGYLVVPIRAAHGHAINDYLSELDQETYQSEYRQIIAAGGDGTINVCVNAMIRNNIYLPLAIMPAGTANDFAYYFNIPNEIDKMLDIALGDNYTYADVGKVNDRYFINVAAIGQVVDVSQKTDPTLKNTIGVLAYYLKGLSEVPNLKPVRVTLTTPEKVY
ncbi:MAG: YegS/Rv2252/BmrU family lipid kinase, partial [Anaerovoracaceae bacterium]